jgi:hypothetical protein
MKSTDRESGFRAACWIKPVVNGTLSRRHFVLEQAVEAMLPNKQPAVEARRQGHANLAGELS